MIVLVRDAVEEQLDRSRTKLANRHGHRGKGRIHVARERNVVETGDRYILRDRDARFPQRAQRADRHRVVRRKNRRRTIAQRQQPQYRSVTSSLCEISVTLEDRIQGDAGFAQRHPIPA